MELCTGFSPGSAIAAHKKSVFITHTIATLVSTYACGTIEAR